MTNALHINALIEHCNKICDEGKCPYHFNSFNSYCELVDEFGEYPCEYGFAIASMKKQIPKKPVFKNDFYGGHLYCPSCMKVIMSTILNCQSNYCNCGQALDWSEIK